MEKRAHWLKKTAEGILAALRRFPAAIGLAAAVAALALVLIHRGDELAQTQREWLTSLLLALSLGMPLATAARLILERPGARPPWLAGAAWGACALLVAAALYLLRPGLYGPLPSMRWSALLLACVALVPAVPFLRRGQGDERFALRLLLRLLATGIFTGILVGGVDLVLLMLEKLLAVRLWEHAYADVAVVAAGLFSPSFLLAGVPAAGSDWETEPFPPLVRVLIGYIAFPLLAAYTAIIYAYCIRILVLWSWPSNMLVNLVLWYTAAGVLAVYLMRPQAAANRWFRLFDTWYPRLTALPVLLAFAGILIRIGAYGFTEARFFVIVLAAWVAASTAIFAFRKPEKRHGALVPALFAALAALAVLGPWSAFSVSALSQNNRLEMILAHNGMLGQTGSVIPKQDVPDRDKQQIYDIIDYFERVQGLGKARALPAGTNIAGVPAALGFDRPTMYPGMPGEGFYIATPMPETLDIAGYDSLYIHSYSKGSVAPQGGIEMKTDDRSVFTILRDGKPIYTKDLTEYVRGLEGSYAPGKVYSPEELTFTDENARVRVKFILTEASMNAVNGNPVYSVPFFYAMVDVK